jgi:hypothetical protein
MLEDNVPGPQVDALVRLIIQALPTANTIDEAVTQVKKHLSILGLPNGHSVELEEAAEVVRNQFERIQILHTHSVIRKRPKWYFGPRPTDLHWPAVKGYLLGSKKWNPIDVQAVDDASNEVVSLLDNPCDPNRKQFSCRGLVVGYVQSGKTANMTAVISKALDAGYNTVFVLAGLTNKLRHQTQLRLYQDLVSRNPLNWQLLTSNEMDLDFRAPAHGGFLSLVNKAQLAVIKKNVSPLRELKLAIERTHPTTLEQLRILVIDDECDQASVNSAKGELDMTVINQRIREILEKLPAVTYVGYTATPFANVLINPYRLDGQELDDLYPRDFITALPRSANYFGTERLFGGTPADPENPTASEEGLDMIRDIPVEEEALLQPQNRQRRDSFQPVMTPSLEIATLYFLASCAARHARGDSNQHMTMLVHTSAYVTAHERVAALIHGWVDVNRSQLTSRHTTLGQKLTSIWESERNRLPEQITACAPVGIDEIFYHLPDVLKRLEYPVENGASEDRINYDKTARTYIVVGGSILARGLTLEGLMVSYFLRTANQYDTLLQMGRWFGYRPRYEDLPRIWMPEELRLRFRFLAGIEQEIREDIDQYRLRDLTPLDLAVRIRTIPGMAITASAKMRAAKQCAVSYWGTHRQTFRFAPADSEINWAAGSELISRLNALGLRDGEAEGRLLWRNAPISSIVRFFRTYKVERTHVDLQPSMLLPFLEVSGSRLEQWNVGVVEARQGTQSVEAFGSSGHVKMVRRAKLKGGNDVIDIKALMSRRDVLFDCVKEPNLNADDWETLKSIRLQEIGPKPLLLLYPIDKDSAPAENSKTRVPLASPHDILGIGIVFPGSITESGSFVSVELRAISADEVAEIDEEEAAQSEAAGV